MSEKKTPAIRFKGFTNGWNRRKLGDIGETFNGLSGKSKVDFGHGKGQFVTYMNVFLNAISDLNILGQTEIDSKQNAVKYGDIFFTTSSETPDEVGMSSVWLGNKENIYLNSFCFGYRPIEQLNPYYMAFMLRSDTIREKIVYLAQGISRYNISKKGMMEIEVPIPSLTEQEKIGEYLNNIDHIITIHQRKLTKLQLLKKSMLTKMFPKDGARVPEIRFQGFHGDWEQHKIGSLTNVLSASRVHKDEWTKDGVPFFRSSDVISAFNGKENEKAFISFKLYEQLVKSSGKLEKNDILITGGGSIGIPYIVPDNTPLYSKDADLIWIKCSNKFDSKFLYTYFTSEPFRDYLNCISHTGTISHYTIEQVKETPIYLPSIMEQKKIGEFFKNLCFNICIYHSKLSKLQQIKQAMLSKLFV